MHGPYAGAVLTKLNKYRIWRLITMTFKEWQEDNAARKAASLAYYTVFSIAPLLIIAIAVAGLALGQEAATGQIVGQIRNLIGEDGAELINNMIKSASQPTTSIVATVIGIVTLMIGATGVFGELQTALNEIWDVKPKTDQNGLLVLARTRFLSLAMVFGIGFLLLVSLVLSAVLAGISAWAGGAIGQAAIVSQIIGVVLTFVVTTLLFAMIFKILPDVHIDWHDVWIGAAMTSVLFSIGRLLIGLYLGNSSVASTYGAAGSLIVLLIWIYYSAQILFLGAEFTQVFARLYGSRRDEKLLVTLPTPEPPKVPAELDDPQTSGLVTSRQRAAALKKLKRERAKLERQAQKAAQPARRRADVIGTVLGWATVIGILLAGIVKGLAPKNEPDSHYDEIYR